MELNILKDLESKVSWLSNYIIHNANYLRLKDDDLKVGGHQASCASVVSILVVLYFKVLNKFDRMLSSLKSTKVDVRLYSEISEQFFNSSQTLSRSDIGG